jgi:exodeoxyribonuclease V alpha subunit
MDAGLVAALRARRISRRFAISPRDIQVLTPVHRGPAGAGVQNSLLQQALAPHRDGVREWRQGAQVFRPGDKVIQIRNNYDKGGGAPPPPVQPAPGRAGQRPRRGQ